MKKQGAEWESERISERGDDEKFILSGIIHDLRTPVTGMRGIADLLLSGDLSDEQKEHVLLLRKASDRMAEIISRAELLLKHKRYKRSIFGTGEGGVDTDTYADYDSAGDDFCSAGIDRGILPGMKRSKVRVLLAEDDYMNREMSKSCLEKAGFLVSTVSTGMEVLEALAKDHYDLVLIDMRMPELDGAGAVRNIRSRKDGQFDPSIPVFALSASSSEDDRELARSAGMDGYFIKPIGKDDIACLMGIIEKPAGLVSCRESIPGGFWKGHGMGINLFMDEYRDDMETGRKIMKIFYLNVSKKMVLIEEALRGSPLTPESTEGLIDMIHSLSNNLLTLRLHPLAELVQGLEGKIKQGTLSEGDNVTEDTLSVDTLLEDYLLIVPGLKASLQAVEKELQGQGNESRPIPDST